MSKGKYIPLTQLVQKMVMRAYKNNRGARSGKRDGGDEERCILMK
jgi:hypothetical protein